MSSDAIGRRTAQELSAPGIVSVWVGRLADEYALDDYVTFRYPPDGSSWSPFTRDHGLNDVDEDFAEAAWWPSGSCSFAEHSYGDSFAPTADADLAERFPDANCGYVVYDVDASRLSASREGPLAFLGSYPYRK